MSKALALLSKLALPAFYAPDDHTAQCTVDFFTANIRNRNTRRAYGRAATDFATWCSAVGVDELGDVRPIHVAGYIEQLTLSAPSVKQQLAALRMLFDWLVVRQAMPSNPAASVRGPRHVVKKGKTPVLAASEARELLDSIDTSTVVGLRDRAIISLMLYTFARVGAVISLRIEDVYTQKRRTWVRLKEKGGKRLERPCHHKLDADLHAYIEAGGLSGQTGVLFRSVRGRSTTLTEKRLAQADVYRMIGRRVVAAGLATRVGCHSFRATGITEYLRNGGKLEIAQQLADHESARTTGLYDRRGDQDALDEIERIIIE